MQHQTSLQENKFSFIPKFMRNRPRVFDQTNQRNLLHWHLYTISTRPVKTEGPSLLWFITVEKWSRQKHGALGQKAKAWLDEDEMRWCDGLLQRARWWLQLYKGELWYPKAFVHPHCQFSFGPTVLGDYW